MAGDAGASTFVTGAAGFLGMALVRVLVARGHRVFGLTRSFEGAERLRRAGAVPVMGDLLEPGRWQDEAAADWVFHLPPHGLQGERLSRTRAASLVRARVLMDAHLLDAVASGVTHRVVYAADAGSYGPTDGHPITEDERPRPSAWGRSVAPALDRVDGYVLAGLPIVTALPGRVYGNASWFRQRVIDPVLNGRRVLQFGTTGPWVSPIHVDDCARALVHLAAHGEPGGRYFAVNSDPIRMHEFAASFASHAKRPLRVWRLPVITARFLVGSILADYLESNAVYSNIRLRGIGFHFHYPTLDSGVQQIVKALHE